MSIFLGVFIFYLKEYVIKNEKDIQKTNIAEIKRVFKG